MPTVTDLGYTVHEEDGSYTLVGERGGRYALMQSFLNEDLYYTINANNVVGNRKLKGGYEQVLHKDGTFYAYK